ncbi:MAG: phospholipase D-like domain-containing protein, partial [Bilophila sp.]
MLTFLVITGLIALHVVAIYSAGHALLHKRDSRSALGWVAVTLLVPFVGSVLYWLFGIARVDSRAVKIMERAAQQLTGGLVDLHGKSLVAKPWGFVSERCLPADLVPLARPGKHITGRCMTGGNTLTPLHNGEAAYPVMLDAIDAAHRQVYLSSFIFGYDVVGKRFAKALKNAAERGCDVRVLMDGVGSFHPLARWRTRLGKAQLAYFLPPRLFPPQFSINLRTHRKVLVCDQIAFTGGMNISEHHLTARQRPNRVQDLHFRCIGPIAVQLELAFLMDWSFATGSPIQLPVLPPESGRSESVALQTDQAGQTNQT